MKYLKILFISLAVLLTGCGTLSSGSSTPSLTKCPKVDHVSPTDFGEVIENYDDLLDLYTKCRLNNNALVDYHLRKK
jgi:hypothetical protein